MPTITLMVGGGGGGADLDLVLKMSTTLEKRKVKGQTVEVKG